LQINLHFDYKKILLIGLSLILWPDLQVTAQGLPEHGDSLEMSVSFIKPEVFLKTGQLSFNVIRVRNLSDEPVSIKPIILLPPGWSMFSSPFYDTIVPAHDSLSLPFRFQLPAQVSAEIIHEIIFRAYTLKNKLLAEAKCIVHAEEYHEWNVILPDQRTFFYPRMNMAKFQLKLENRGNTAETIDLDVKPDAKITLTTDGIWHPGQQIVLAPYQDTILNFTARYTFAENRVFDISKVQVNAVVSGKKVQKPLLIEKYNDTYAPFFVDRNLPHQVELGFRFFSGNDRLLPFIKARGLATFKNLSTFQYNFNYYALTGNENFISNSYYSFLYSWKLLRAGVGAFSSQLGRNLYTRHGVMFSNAIRLTPTSTLEAFVCQSFFTPKTSVAVGYTFMKNKLRLMGSVAYDVDSEKKVNTGSAKLQSNLITIKKGHDVSFNLYGYYEDHYMAKNYTLAGYAWDLNYVGRFGKIFSIQLSNNYGSPNIPGPQMGILNFGFNSVIPTGSQKSHISLQYRYNSRKYYAYSGEGNKLPYSRLYDQYGNLLIHSYSNPNHKWYAGPSYEYYHSFRPTSNTSKTFTEYTNQFSRFEYKATIYRNFSLTLKTGLSNINITEATLYHDLKFDLHILGMYSFKKGFALSFNYDYGPMVSSGLYQFASDVQNHSLAISPSLVSTFMNGRIKFDFFASFVYRFDLDYAGFNINPKFEIYLFRDFYAIASGTYNYTRETVPEFAAELTNSYTYFEFSIKKRWGKSDINKWQKDTRQLTVVMFKDENGNGLKEDDEEGVPFVKARLMLTNTDVPDLNPQFPVDIILLSNEAGVVNYNRLPKGFYELTITPLTDVKEYFYVNRSAEKLELSKNTTYYIPFQKAGKITGRIDMQRSKFIKSGEEVIDLENIKITAYTVQGNSYSSFTLTDGSFTIFVPQNNTYYVRMGNIFGPSFKILKNDILINVGSSMNNQVVFNVTETGRQIKFKEAKPAEADTTQQEPLKIKVLHGKLYENSPEAAVDKNATPVFDIKEAPVPETTMIPGNYYVVIGSDSTRTEAVKLYRIVAENGMKIKLGHDEVHHIYYVFTEFFETKGEAREELERIVKLGLRNAEIMLYK